MPDPTRKTISASQAPALYNASPYITPWMLFHYLRGTQIDRPSTDRMQWGLRLQPLVLEQAAQDLKLEIEPNTKNHYLHSNRGPLGYTADAFIRCPDRGLGSVEVKCVFDYGVWMREWSGGNAPPRYTELQLQQQLAVGDGTKPFEWGVIAVWICAEMKYFERARDPKVTDDLIERCAAFMASVYEHREPDPFGNAAELPILAELFPVVKDKLLDLRDDPQGRHWAETAAAFKDFKDKENFFSKAASKAREQMLFMAKDNERVLLPGATLKLRTVNVKEHMRKASSYVQLNIELTGEEQKPKELPDGSPV